jgi:hypothetical protein
MSDRGRRPAVRRKPEPVRRVRLALYAATVAAGALAVSGIPAQAAGPRARAARTINVKDEAKLHFVKSSGSTLIDEGNATGTIPGKVRIVFTYNGSPNVSSQLTIYGSGGSLHVRASGKLSSPTNPKPSFKGSLTVTGGTGRYAHAGGTGTLYGVFNRRTYAMVVQAQGPVHY